MKINYYRHNDANQYPRHIISSFIFYNELTFVLSGSLIYEINGEAITVNANDCIYIKSGSHRKRTATGPCEYISFNFQGGATDNLPVYLPECINKEITLLFKTCDEIFAKYYMWTDKIGTALKLILQILSEKIQTSQENPIIVNIKRYVKRNLEKKLTLNDICRQVGYSPNYCDSLFKKETGYSIMNYAINEKIEKAKLLIAEDLLSLKEIAKSLGFDDYNYFSRTFKNKSGYPPTRYKAIIEKEIFY